MVLRNLSWVCEKSMKYKIILVVGLLLVIWFGWRLSSRRHALPCPVWLRWMVELDNPFARHNRAAVIIKELDLAVGMKVLDAGCGPGRLTIPVAKNVGPQGRVCAMDIQQGMLQAVGKKACLEHLSNVTFLHARLGEGACERNSFDRALLVTVLGEIPEQEKAFTEVFEALKPGGLLAVTEIIFDPHFQSKATVRRLATAVGLTEKKTAGPWYSYIMIFEKIV